MPKDRQNMPLFMIILIKVRVSSDNTLHILEICLGAGFICSMFVLR